MARQIHELGWQRRGSFIALNRAARWTRLDAELFAIEDRTATPAR